MTQIASGYLHRTDPAALVVGPTGLVFDAKTDVLYVASTGDNAVFAVPHAKETTHDAGMGRLVYKDSAHLRGPLGMVQAPNGDLIVSNGDAVNGDATQPSELVEFTPQGKFVAQFSLDPVSGSAFGLALKTQGDRVELVAVNDDTNSIEIFNLDRPER
jgi:sugar lactone lactonase YvrE